MRYTRIVNIYETLIITNEFNIDYSTDGNVPAIAVAYRRGYPTIGQLPSFDVDPKPFPAHVR